MVEESLNNTIILIHDITGKIIFSLPEEARQNKNDHDLNFLSLIHPDQHDIALQNFSKSKERGIIEYDLDIRNIEQQQQQYKNFLVQSRFFVNGNQQLIHSHLYPKVTLTGSVEPPNSEKLHPDKQLKFLLDKSNVPTLLSEVNGRLIYCNSPALDLLKIDHSKTYLYFASDFYVTPQKRVEFLKILETEKKCEINELKIKDSRGHVYCVQLKSRMISLHGQEVLLSNLIDITNYKEIEADYQITRRRLDLATNTAKIGLWEYNLINNDVTWNDAMYQLVNHAISSKEDKLEFFINHTSESQREKFIQFLNNREEVLFLDHVVKFDNQEKNYRTTCKKHFNRSGDLIKILAVTKDITELQKNKKLVIENLKDKELIAKITTTINSDVSFQTSIYEVLELLGLHLQVNFIAIAYFDKTKGAVRFQWNTDNERHIHHEELSLSDLQLINQKTFFDDYHQLPKPLQLNFIRKTNQKFCFCPLVVAEEQQGYLIISKDQRKVWHHVTSEWIDTVLHLITRAFEKEEHRHEIIRQQNLLRNITDNLTDVITQTDIDGNITYASPGWLKVLGYHPHEVIGKSAFNFIHPEDLPVVMSKFNNLEKTKTATAQFRYLSKSGKFQWGETRSSLIINKENQIEGIISGGYVIEERVKAELALRSNEQKYRTLFEKAPIGVLLVDAEGNVQEMNQELIKTFKLEDKELLTLNVFHKSWLKRSGIFTEIKNCINTRKAIVGEDYFLEDNKRTIIFKYYLNPLVTDDELVQVHGVLVDITNQKKIEQDLKQNQLKLQQITTNITDLITEIDKNGTIVYASPSWESILGYNPKQIVGTSIAEMLVRTSPSNLQKQISRRSNNKSKKTYQHKMKSKTGKVLWFESTGQSILDKNNTKAGIIFGSSDITERKQAEQLLIDQNSALKKANDELDRFVYRSSHDLQAPLTSVLGLINISKYSEDIAERNNFLLLMEQTIKKLNKVIKQITTYSRNARLKVSSELIDFNQLWRELQEELSFIEKFDEIQFTFSINQSEDFYNDKERVFNIIKNIITNAIIYRSMEDNKNNNWVNCDISIDLHRATIEISDNGTGILKEEQDKIFDMFHRSSNISKGAGLGLYIAKEMLLQINGFIEVESEVGKGSRFIIMIPNTKK